MSKKSNISRIKKILYAWGGTSTGELQSESSPIIFSLGNVSVLAEGFYIGNVEAIVYHNDMEIDRDYIDYEDLNDDVIFQIKEILESYDADMNKTMQERIKD